MIGGLAAMRELLDVVRKQLKAEQATREDAERERDQLQRERDELRLQLFAEPEPPTSASEPTTEKLEELDEDVPGVPPPLGKFDESKLRYWRKIVGGTPWTSSLKRLGYHSIPFTA